MFCESVERHLCFIDHLNCVKMVAFQFHLQSGNFDTFEVIDAELQVALNTLTEHDFQNMSNIFRQIFPGEKGSVRWCIVVMQQPVLL
jgi:hypothetical protein